MERAYVDLSPQLGLQPDVVGSRLQSLEGVLCLTGDQIKTVIRYLQNRFRPPKDLLNLKGSKHDLAHRLWEFLMSDFLCTALFTSDGQQSSAPSSASSSFASSQVNCASSC
jgi:hypothetical protein